MTSQDELRDRIAKVLDQNFNPDQYPIMTAMFRDYAQAIIDELGLTIETHATDQSRNPHTRIISEWKRP